MCLIFLFEGYNRHGPQLLVSKIAITHRKSDFSIRGVVDQDPTMAMLAITILVNLWVVYWASEPPTLIPRSNLRTCGTTVQPSYLAHARLSLVGCLVFCYVRFYF